MLGEGWSRPARTRGLKLAAPWSHKTVIVASRADAWIETHVPRLANFRHDVASRADAWIETGMKSPLRKRKPGRVPRGRVD